MKTIQDFIELGKFTGSLVGKRFKSVEEITHTLEEYSKLPVNLIESETDADFLNDYQLDGEFVCGDEEYEPFTLWYLKDKTGLLLITEIG